MKVRLILLISMIFMVIGVTGCKKESEENLKKEVKLDEISKDKTIFLEIYQAEWYIQNVLAVPNSDNTELFLTEKDKVYQFFSRKYNISLDEIKNIKSLDYSNDGFIFCQKMQQELGHVVKNYE